MDYQQIKNKTMDRIIPRLEKSLGFFDDSQKRIALKLLHDLLFLILLFFALSLVAEGVLPGIVTSHVGFPKILLFIFVLISAIYLLGRTINWKSSGNKATLGNKKTVVALLIISILLILNAQIKLNFLLNIFLTVAFATLSYFLFKAASEE
jgi:hypothetical protein